jgi:hypothetical protein
MATYDGRLVQGVVEPVRPQVTVVGWGLHVPEQIAAVDLM